MRKLYLFTILPFFFSCDLTQPDVKNTQIFSGYLYEDCNMEPKINHEVNLFQDYEIGLIDDTGGPLATGYTDSTGYFRLKFNHDGIGAIHFREGTNNLMDFIPWNLEIAEVNVFRHPTCNIQINLNAENSYSDDDILIVNNLNDLLNNVEINGPFEDGVLYEISNYTMLGMIYDTTFGGLKFVSYLDIGYKVNEIEWSVKRFNISACDSIFVVLDIY